MIIQKTLKIEITQADVVNAITALITKEDPSIVVDNITFSHKRKGSDDIGINIDAHFADTEEPAPVVEEAESNDPTEEVPPFEIEAEEGGTVEEEEELSPKQSLFG